MRRWRGERGKRGMRRWRGERGKRRGDEQVKKRDLPNTSAPARVISRR